MKKWSLQQVVLLAFLAFLFGGVFMGAGFLYALLNAALLPLGLSPFANELLFGMWTMVAPIASDADSTSGKCCFGGSFSRFGRNALWFVFRT
ncbi:hypothetical protein EfsSVR2331_01570 [Enterococcus faecalis]|nr:hypothetical protein EfsSVR2331_01570 [Enterococcus faecalis]